MEGDNGMKTKTTYKPGDIIRTEGVYMDDNGDIIRKEEAALVLDVFKTEKEEGTTIYYNVVKRPVEWDDIYDLEEGTYTRVFSEDFIKCHSKKIGHVNIAKWRKAK